MSGLGVLRGILGEPEVYEHLGPIYKLNDLRARFDDSAKLSEWLYALVKYEDTWVKVSFVEVYADRPEGVEVQHFFSSEGPSGSLRECRHTHFGERADGYMFHLDFGQLRLALDFLGQFFDGD